MKLSINRAELADALTIASSMAPTRTPKPILQCVLIDAFDDYVRLSATDLEVGVRYNISQVEVEKTGSIAVSADKLGQIVRESKEEVLTVESVDSVCHVRGHDSHFQVNAHDAESFPPVADAEGDFDIEINLEALRSLGDWTVFAAARENTRYAINGVLWEQKGNELTLVATDGRRLSKAVQPVQGGESEHTAIVPTKGMHLFARALSESGTTIGVKFTPGQILLKSARATVSAALLEGRFPKYEDVIPDDGDKTVEFDTQELLSAVRRAALLTNEESKGVRLAFTRGTLTLSSRAPEQGEAVITMPINYEGDEVDIGFNPVFLTDVLRVVSSDKIRFEFKEAARPGVFRMGDAFLYVVMPVNLS